MKLVFLFLSVHAQIPEPFDVCDQKFWFTAKQSQMAQITDPDKVCPDGGRPVHLAAKIPPAEVFLAFLEHNPKLDFRDDGGDTALNLAVRHGRVENALALVERGADPSAPNNKGTTPLMWAAKFGNTTVAEALVGAGADLDAKNRLGSALMSASITDDAEIVALLLDSGADPNVTDYRGTTALMLSQSAEVTRMLIEADADLDLQDNFGLSALMWAVFIKKPAIVKALILAGADLGLRTDKDKSALDLALNFKDNPKMEPVIEALQLAGAP